MIKSSIEKLAEDIGLDIGRSDNISQSNLLNGFCKGINTSCHDNHKLDLQLCYVVDKLTPESYEVIKILYGHIKFRENEKN